MICGLVMVKKQKCMFRLEGNKLYLTDINNIGKRYTILDWFNNRSHFDGEHLYGINQITGNHVIFKTIPEDAKLTDTETIINIQYYLELNSKDKISRILIKCDELNYIYNVQKCIEANEFNEDGNVSCKTKSFEETTSKKEHFTCCEKDVKVYFTIYRGLKFNSCTPLTLCSSIILEFEKTNDYDYIYKLIGLVKRFISYLCYRKNIHINDITLQSKNNNRKYINIGTFYNSLEQNNDLENIDIVSKNYISYDGIKGHIGEIFQDLDKDVLYMRHLPEDYRDYLKLNCSKYIMITAAIEWISKELYPNGIKHRAGSKEALEIVEDELNDKLSHSSRTYKKIYKSIITKLHEDPLSDRIYQIFKDYSDLVTPFGINLYKSNNIPDEFNFVKISRRIEKQRNNFAHGNLAEDYDKIAYVDIVFVERIIYILQLLRYGIEKEKIITEVKRLFSYKSC